MKTLHAVGAYGREASQADWEAGKDFRVIDGPYFSKRSLDLLREDGYTHILFWDFRLIGQVFEVTL
jgi:hypothetical protein